MSAEEGDRVLCEQGVGESYSCPFPRNKAGAGNNAGAMLTTLQVTSVPAVTLARGKVRTANSHAYNLYMRTHTHTHTHVRAKTDV